MAIKQLSIFVENKPGRLAEITNALSQKNIDIRALSIADTTDFGILRLIVDNPAQAESILKEDGFTVSQTDVIAIGLVDRPGQLAKALSVLQNAGVGVEYMYAFVSREDGTAAVIFRVENSALAEANLAKEGFEILSKEDVCKL